MPISYSIPGSYSVGTIPSRHKRTCRPVSAKQAKEGVIPVHGDKMSILVPVGSSLNETRMFERFQGDLV